MSGPDQPFPWCRSAHCEPHDLAPERRAAASGTIDGMPILNKDMSVCISLAGRPSNLGTRFHNFLYDELGLNFIYKAFTTDDIEGAVARHPGARHPRMLGVDAVQGGGDPARRRAWRTRRRRSSR